MLSPIFHLSVLLILATSSILAIPTPTPPSHEKNSTQLGIRANPRTIKITTPENTRLMKTENVKDFAIDGDTLSVGFSQDPSGDEEKALFWDIFEEGSGFTKQLYHLTCHVKVQKSFSGTAIVAIHTTRSPLWVTMTSAMWDAKQKVSILCPKDEARCLNRVDHICREEDTGVPSWDDISEY